MQVNNKNLFAKRIGHAHLQLGLSCFYFTLWGVSGDLRYLTPKV